EPAEVPVRRGLLHGGRGPHEDAVGLELEDGPRHEDQLPRGDEVHRASRLDLLEEHLREFREVEVPGVELLLDHELERRGDRLLERVTQGDVHPLVDLAEHRHVAADPLRPVVLADQGLVEQEVVQDGLVRLAHAVTASTVRSSSTSDRFTFITRSECPAGVIVTPMMWSASFSVIFRREIWTNWAVFEFRLIIRATRSAFTASRFWSISSKR